MDRIELRIVRFHETHAYETNLRTANKDVGGEVVRLRAVQILVALIAALAVDRKGSNTPKGSVNQ
jgi:hypothetical protein